MVERALLGAIVAALVTALARRLQALDESGQWAAFACGILASAGGWPWAGVLVGYCVLATAVTTLGEAEKQRRTERSVPQVNTRNAFQVAANGGVFALLAARAGIAAIVGAFLAGMALSETVEHRVHILTEGVTGFLTPFFLVGIGLHFDPTDRKSTRLNSSHMSESRMPSSA